jgi:hypothetical protein
VFSITPRSLYSQGKSPWYPLDRRLGGPENPDRPARSPALYRLSCHGSSPYIYRNETIYKRSTLFNSIPQGCKSRGSSVGIVTRQRTGRLGFWGDVQFLAEVENFFSFPPRPDRLWGPPSFVSNVYRRLFSQW